jgi:hypothetical protein
MSDEDVPGGAPPSPYEGKVPDPAAPPVPAEPKAVPALVSPPRHVPGLVRASNLLGGFLNQFAWAWLGITGLLLWFFLPNADVAGLYYFQGDMPTAAGVVAAAEETNFEEDDTDVYAHTYRFTGPDGVEREGVSYDTGRRLEAGAEVTVEYVPDDPAISRIHGMRRKPFGVEGWGGLLMLGMMGLFSLIGLGFLAAGVRRGFRANRLLGSGRIALGRLKAKRATNTRINDRTVWAFDFEFDGEDLRTHQATAKTHEVDRLSDPRGEFLLYDPVEPWEAVLLDNIPGAVRISEQGYLETDRPRKAALSLLLPVLVLSAHGVIAWFVLL